MLRYAKERRLKMTHNDIVSKVATDAVVCSVHLRAVRSLSDLLNMPACVGSRKKGAGKDVHIFISTGRKYGASGGWFSEAAITLALNDIGAAHAYLITLKDGAAVLKLQSSRATRFIKGVP